MKIIFVRHGHPDYKKDCLTEIGHPQAEAVAERLKNEKVDKIFSSSCGRAYETAQHIAAKHNLNITQLDFMREIRWGSKETNDLVQPWWLVDQWVANGKDVMNLDWKNDNKYKGHQIVESYNLVSAAFDEWLKTLGFRREGCYYRVDSENNNTIVLVSHGGSSSVVISHIFNLPFPFVCRAICPDFTAITVVDLVGQERDLTSPRFEIVNDARHIQTLTTENYFGQ